MDILKSSSSVFRAQDSTDSDFYIEGRLDEGSLSFEVVAQRGNKRGQYSGRDFFDAMMSHFGDQVKRILAVWSDANPAFGTNLMIFNDETSSGSAKGDAAFKTKTGQWVQDFGFTEIDSLDTIPDEFPGGYEQVYVEFVNPD